MNTILNRTLAGGLLVLGASLPLASGAAQTIPVVQLHGAPALDGADDDWSEVTPTTVALRKTRPDGKSDVPEVEVRAGIFGDEVYFLFRWRDSSEDLMHKPFVWNADKGRYEKGTQKEDRLAIQFLMDGEYSTDWLSGKLFTADMWHWKSSRSNPLGLAHDKMTMITDQPVKRAYKAATPQGKTIYIRRPGDAGDKLYTSKRYGQKEGDVMPKYMLASTPPQGSIADIKARGVWKDGMWTLEMKRKLDTGNADDVRFERGQAATGGIAIFNHSGNDDHNISENLTFRFEPAS